MEMDQDRVKLRAYMLGNSTSTVLVRPLLPKAKDFLLHSLVELEWRGIVPTQYSPRHWMEVNGQHHAPAALYTRGKNPQYPSDRSPVGPSACLDTEDRGEIVLHLPEIESLSPVHAVRN
jgi:hypothetical protein